MSDIEKNISFPLDTKGFFRRACPFCQREFKVLVEKEELNNLAQESLESFMVEKEKTVEEKKESKFFCPYCGQQSPSNSWWTEPQLQYIRDVAKNVMADLVNKDLINPLKNILSKSNSGLFSISFKGKEMEQKELHMAPDVDDMEIFDLPCCNRKIKIENIKEDKVYCFFCGFPHKIR